ncbi:hypothetical protein Dimus_008061, partial [Dionaea muscipula]
EIVRIKEADGSKALGFDALLTRVFENTLILLEEELDEACGGLLNHFTITQSKVLERINARAAQVDVNPDDVNGVVDELMDDAGGIVNAPRQAFSSSTTTKLGFGDTTKTAAVDAKTAVVGLRKRFENRCICGRSRRLSAAVLRIL